MTGSGTGPLGLLLLIAPLAAIPVFATVGVPHFSLLSQSHAEEDAIDWNDSVSDSASDDDEPRSAGRSRKRSADDLFSPPAEEPVAKPSRPLRRELAPRGATPRKGGRAGIAAPGAFDDWNRRSGSEEAPPSGAFGQPGESEGEPGTDQEGAGNPPRLDQFDSSVFENRRESPGKSGTGRSGSRSGRQNHPELAPRGGSKSGTSRDADVEKSGWQSALQRLKSLGVRKYRLDPQLDQQNFLFMCQFDAPGHRRITRRFEAEAETPLAAVELVLSQIEAWVGRDGVLRLPEAGDDVE
jgi:hypothetical protein